MSAIYWLSGALLAVSAIAFTLAYAFGAAEWPLRRQTWLRLGQWLIALSLLGGIGAGSLPRAWSPQVRLPKPLRVAPNGFVDLDGAGMRIARSSSTATGSALTPAKRPLRISLAAVLALGFLFGAGRLLWHVLKLRRLVASSLTIRRCGRVAIHVSSQISIPFSWRFLRRAHVVLPMSVLEHRHDLRSAVHHEVQHHRNGDTRWVFAMEILKVLFFWNPAIYLWARQMAQLVELACDEAVVTRKPLGSHDYGYCLLRVAEATLHQRSAVYLGTAGMSTRDSGKSFLMRRIEMLTTYRKTGSRRGVVAALGMGLGLMVAVAAYAGAAVIRGGHGPQRLPAVNPTVQRIAEEALHAGVKTAKADGAFAIVADPRTGEVLAVAYDGKHADREAHIASYLAQPMEPWSLIKPVVTALAIEQGKTTLDEMLDCGHGKIDVGTKEYSDHTVFDKLSTAQMLVQSSNVGAIRVALKLGAENLAKGFETFGFGRDYGFPMAGVGDLPSGAGIQDSQYVPNSAFGFALRLTPLELVQAYGAIADGGMLLKPQEYRSGSITAEPIQRVISTETAAKMRGALAQVVSEGTGKRAQLDNVTAAGKTATGRWTRVFDGKEHPKTEVASFIGFAPAESPRLLVYVNVENPHNGDTQGGRHAAPIFKEIAQNALATLKN